MRAPIRSSFFNPLILVVMSLETSLILLKVMEELVPTTGAPVMTFPSTQVTIALGANSMVAGITERIAINSHNSQST